MIICPLGFGNSTECPKVVLEWLRQYGLKLATYCRNVHFSKPQLSTLVMWSQCLYRAPHPVLKPQDQRYITKVWKFPLLSSQLQSIFPQALKHMLQMLLIIFFQGLWKKWLLVNTKTSFRFMHLHKALEDWRHICDCLGHPYNYCGTMPWSVSLSAQQAICGVGILPDNYLFLNCRATRDRFVSHKSRSYSYFWLSYFFLKEGFHEILLWIFKQLMCLCFLWKVKGPTVQGRKWNVTDLIV